MTKKKLDQKKSGTQTGPTKERNHETEAKNNASEWALPAIRGVQAGGEYYSVMVHLRDVAKLFAPVDGKLPPELRAQRVLSKVRVPKIADYITNNPTNYTLPALVGAIDGLPRFEPAHENSHMGTLYIPRDMTIAVLDGQHRRAAVAMALSQEYVRKRRGSLGDESLCVTLFVDAGLEKAQQRFADLNRFAVRPNNSLGLLYDHRDELAKLTRAVVRDVFLFHQLTDGEKTSVSGGSNKLFALASIHAATKALLAGFSGSFETARQIAVEFWTEATRVMPDWHEVGLGKIRASALRDRCVHAHAVVLEALGRVGNAVLRERREEWKSVLTGLGRIDWSRNNPRWEGRAVVNGRVLKNAASVILTANLIKHHLELELSIEERRHEPVHANHADEDKPEDEDAAAV
ncbi:DNA sulfur modification protein DndB [Polyangium jinanense]|uniref:DNA sulfur modification protein DndB n=1 Tax=Polyangium jinanense TaxID=2829994 RepID=UPI0023404249|nr:DNA sulfur modification protein DndB [Polyangium jinanense]MDC3956893.1 DNA sulfur modification protein DndB [Polyangium jinanense]